MFLCIICNNEYNISGSAFINPIAIVKTTEREIQSQILPSED